MGVRVEGGKKEGVKGMGCGLGSWAAGRRLCLDL